MRSSATYPEFTHAIPRQLAHLPYVHLVLSHRLETEITQKTETLFSKTSGINGRPGLQIGGKILNHFSHHRDCGDSISAHEVAYIPCTRFSPRFDDVFFSEIGARQSFQFQVRDRRIFQRESLKEPTIFLAPVIGFVSTTMRNTFGFRLCQRRICSRLGTSSRTDARIRNGVPLGPVELQVALALRVADCW